MPPGFLNLILDLDMLNVATALLLGCIQNDLRSRLYLLDKPICRILTFNMISKPVILGTAFLAMSGPALAATLPYKTYGTPKLDL